MTAIATTELPTAPSGDVLYEVVDGQIVEMEPMGTYHQIVVGFLFFSLESYVRQNRLGRAVVELLFDFTEQLGRKCRPDLAFVSEETWPRSRSIDESDGWQVVPDLAVEIVSPSNSWNEITGKMEEYFQVGSKQVWVICPAQFKVYVYGSSTSVSILQLGDSLTSETLLPGFSVTLHELFETDGAGRRDA